MQGSLPALQTKGAVLFWDTSERIQHAALHCATSTSGLVLWCKALGNPLVRAATPEPNTHIQQFILFPGLSCCWDVAPDPTAGIVPFHCSLPAALHHQPA